MVWYLVDVTCIWITCNITYVKPKPFFNILQTANCWNIFLRLHFVVSLANYQPFQFSYKKKFHGCFLFPLNYWSNNLYRSIIEIAHTWCKRKKIGNHTVHFEQNCINDQMYLDCLFEWVSSLGRKLAFPNGNLPHIQRGVKIVSLVQDTSRIHIMPAKANIALG